MYITNPKKSWLRRQTHWVYCLHRSYQKNVLAIKPALTDEEHLVVFVEVLNELLTVRGRSGDLLGSDVL